MLPRKTSTVMGRRIAPPRPTLGALGLGLLYIAAPLLIITGLLDLAMQVLFGVCTGVWCLAR
ncbi:hypothetical protein [Maricaulis sp. CAU 1757]